MRKLSLVVTCTDRKMAAPLLTLRAASLPSGSTRQRASEWVRRVDAAPERHPLEQLYQGDHWAQSLKLVAAARTAGFDAGLWVASAGLGLQPINSKAPAYAATFSGRNPDLVASTVTERAQWWTCLQSEQGQVTLAELGQRGAVLVALSEAYSEPLRGELQEVAQTGAECVLIGGASDVAGLQRIPSDAALRHALGGTLTSLNARMAAAWLSHCEDGVLLSVSSLAAWQKWSGTVARSERYERTPMSDGAVRAFVREEWQRTAGLSRTAMLRRLRDSGLACEQRRFGLLYAEALGER
ncbi:hypothetical protein [Catenulispora pinisilvae]|uniref:hypothetical protein n=1 Tax=Catenulispora pinisilvae TaxID=2705253 RepID=UPI00189193BA|nr:hypothetical protein [Catenulispora pinisilvae]